MTRRNWKVPLLLTVAVVGFILAAIVYRVASASALAGDFLRTRNLVYDALHENINEPLGGVTILLPPTKEALLKVAKPFPDDGHIQSVVRERDWQGGGGFQLVLELDDSLLSAGGQGNSETMTATKLLKHYFRHLEKLGLRTRGTPGVVLGKVQSATNEWTNEPDQSIAVTGTVFVAPESKQAILIGTIRERFPN